MTLRLPVLIAISTLSCGAAAADEPSFSFADLTYIRAEHGSGAAIRGSGAIGERWFIQGNFDAYDHFDGSVGLASLGVGMHWPVSPSMQLAFGLSAVAVGGAYEDGHDSGMDGAALGGGATLELRGRVGERLELLGGVKYIEVTDTIAPSIGIRFYFSRRLALGLDVSDDFVGTRAGLALHYDFRSR
jgi:hypothetical protein